MTRFILRRLSLCFVFFLWQQTSLAVDVIICQKENSTQTEIADLYEAKKLRQFDFENLKHQTPDQVEEQLWNKLSLKSKARLNYFTKDYADPVFLKKTRIQPNIRFENDWTNSYVFVEKNCRVQTFAEVYKKQFPLDPDFIIDQTIWNQLSPFQKLVTKTHLLFAGESLQYSASLPELRQIQLRYYNSLFWSNLWSLVKTQSLFQLSQQLGFETESSQNLIFSIQNKNTQFWNEDLIQKGVLQAGATGHLQDGQSFIQNHGFFEQDIHQNILTLPHRSELEFQTPLGLLKAKDCITEFYKNSQMKYTCFSPQQNIQIQKPNMQLEYFANPQKNAPTYFYPNGSIYSARNIQGRYLTSWGKWIHFNVEGESQFSEIHFSEQGQILYIEKILEPLQIQTKAGLIETDTGSFLSFYPSGQLKCANAKNKKFWLLAKNQKKYWIDGIGFCLTEEGYYHPPGENNLYLSFTDSFQIKETL